MHAGLPGGKSDKGAFVSNGVERGEISGFHVVDPEVYRKYRAEVVRLANSHQHNRNEFLDEETRRRALSDVEIAEKLGIDVRDVTEIRAVAEHDEYPLEEYEASARFKDAAAASYMEGGVAKLYRDEKPPTRQ